MAGTMELERMIVRLVGDASSYQHMISEAIHLTQSFGKTITSILTNLASTVGSLALGAFSDFELGMAKLEGLVGIAKDKVDAFGESILRMAPALGKSPQELANALYYITSGGLKGAKALDALTYSAKASIAGLGDTKTVADAVKSAVNAYAFANLGAARATDILVAAIREGKLEASTLAGVMGRVLPMASALGMQFYDVAGAIAAMSRVGSSAQDATSSLNSLMMGLMKPTKEGADGLAEVGLSYEMLRNMLKKPGGIIEVIRTVSKAFDANDTAITKTFPNMRSLRGVFNLLSQDAKTVDAVMKGVRDSVGATDAAFAAVAKTFSFQFKQMWASVQVFLVQIGEMLAPVMERINILLAKGIVWWQGLGREVQRMVVYTLMISVALLTVGPMFSMFAGTAMVPLVILGGILGKLALGIFNILIPLKLVGAGLMLWFSPTFVILRTFLSLAGVLVIFIKQAGGLEDAWRQVEEATISLWNWLQPIREALSQLFTTIAKEGLKALETLGRAMLVSIQGMAKWLGIAKIDWKMVQQAVVDAIHGIELVILNLGRIVSNTFNTIISLGKYFISWWNSASTQVATGGDTWISYFYKLAASFRLVESDTKSLKGWFEELTGSTNTVTNIVIFATTTFILLAAAIQIVNIALNLSGVAWLIYKIAQIASMFVVGAWTATLVLAKVVMILFNATLIVGAVLMKLLGVGMLMVSAIIVVYNFVTMGATAISIVFAAAIVGIWAAVLLLGAVLILVTGVGLVVFALALAAVAVVLGFVIGLVWGVFSAVGAVIGILLKLPSSVGPLKAIGDIFKELYGVFGLVIRAMKVDMDLAWRILAAGGALAVERVKDLWPPLWTFMKTGWSAIADFMMEKISTSITLGIANSGRAVNKMWNDMGFSTKRSDKSLDEMEANAKKKAEGAAKSVDFLIREAIAAFSITEGEGSKTAKKALATLQKELEAIERAPELPGKATESEKAVEEAKKAADELALKNDKIGDSYKSAAGEIKKFDAVLLGSAESASRWQAYMRLINPVRSEVIGNSIGGVVVGNAIAAAGGVALAGGGGGIGGGMARGMVEPPKPKAAEAAERDPRLSRIIDILVASLEKLTIIAGKSGSEVLEVEL